VGRSVLVLSIPKVQDGFI
jgi:hypothetical protein